MTGGVNPSLRIVATALALLVAPLGWAADELALRVYHFPSQTFLEFDPANPSAPPKPRPGVRALPKAGEYGGPRFDVRELFVAAGMSFSAGSEATYYSESGALVMHAPEVSIAAWEDALVDRLPNEQVDSVRLTFTLVEFTAARGGLELARLGYPELRRQAGGSWRELRTITFSGPSGRRAGASNISAAGKKPPAPPPPRPEKDREALPVMVDLGPDEWGIRCIVEFQVGPDGRACDLGYVLQWRAARGEAASKLESNIQLLEDHPAVLQLDTPPPGSAPVRPHRQCALIVAFHVIKLGDWREGWKPPIAKPGGKAKK